MLKTEMRDLHSPSRTSTVVSLQNAFEMHRPECPEITGIVRGDCKNVRFSSVFELQAMDGAVVWDDLSNTSKQGEVEGRMHEVLSIKGGSS